MLRNGPLGPQSSMESIEVPEKNESSQSSTDQVATSDDSLEETLVFENHGAAEVPAEIEQTLLNQSTELLKMSLRGNRLTTLPDAVGALTSLTYLNLSGNRFAEVPSAVQYLRSLEILDMSSNMLTTLPFFLRHLPSLVGLSLETNQFETLPVVISELPKLVILEMGGNPLRLPEHLQNMEEESWVPMVKTYVSQQQAALSLSGVPPHAVIPSTAPPSAATSSTALSSLARCSESPSSGVSTSDMLVNEALKTEALTSEALSSEPLMNEALMNEEPISDAPISEAPFSEAPVSEAPIRERSISERSMSSTPSSAAPPAPLTLLNLPQATSTAPPTPSDVSQLPSQTVNMFPTERMRSASESGLSLRSSKRMGFVMSRNATDQSYVANLHARGTSMDFDRTESDDEEHMHGRSLSVGPTLASLDEPRSPLPRSPFNTPLSAFGMGPWDSPRLDEGRLSTLAEERDADTDIDSPVDSLARSEYGEREQLEREYLEREYLERKHLEREPSERDPSEREPSLIEPSERDPSERDPTERDLTERDHIEHGDRERADRERSERDYLDRERGERSPEHHSLFKDSFQERHPTKASSMSSTVSASGSITGSVTGSGAGSTSGTPFSATFSEPNSAETKSRSASFSLRSPTLSPGVTERIRTALTNFGDFCNDISDALSPNESAMLAEATTLTTEEQWFNALRSFMFFLEKLVAPTVFASVMSRLSRRQQRAFGLAIAAAFPELESAWREIQQSKLSPLGFGLDSNGQDEMLHTQLEFAAKQTQTVLALLNGVVAKSAVAAASSTATNADSMNSTPAIPAGTLEEEVPASDVGGSSGMAGRVRDLSSVCIRGSGATRTVKKLLDQRKLGGIPVDRRRFWDDVNQFLKAVVAILHAVKTSLRDMPLLADKRVGIEVAGLTRVAKEIPPLLEQSSYRLLLDSEEFADLGGISNLVPPTPLTATIGAAAQALVSPSDQRLERPGEGYVQYGFRAHSIE